MKTSKALITVCVLIAVLALVQSAAGVFWNSNGSHYSFTTLHGEIVPMYGKGIYRDNPAFNAPIQRGTDAVALILYIPLLVAGIILYQRGSARGHLFLTGILASFVYHAASVAFGVAYNPLFLLYIALFSASLFAFVMAVVTFDQRALAARVGTSTPPNRWLFYYSSRLWVCSSPGSQIFSLGCRKAAMRAWAAIQLCPPM
jgi:hypothetical protein